MPKFSTVRFGELQYEEGDVILLPEGLVGMPTLRNWLILEMGGSMPMRWLQSLDRGDFGFPVAQPDLFHDEYEIDLSASVRARLQNTDEGDLATLIITTVHPGGTKVTGNLLAPLIMDTESRRGAQVTQDDSKYGVRQEINYFKFGLAVNPVSSDNESDGSGDETLQDRPEADSAHPETDTAENPDHEGVTC